MANYSQCYHWSRIIRLVPTMCAGINLFLLTGPGNTDTIYVSRSKTGLSNFPPGSQFNPYSTITKAVAVAEPGDVISVQSAYYPEKLTINKQLRISASGRAIIIGKFGSTVQSLQLERSLLFTLADDQKDDGDYDGLIDLLEGKLAYAFRPYLVFDCDEKARQPNEPVTLFQVRKLDTDGTIGGRTRIGIKWVFLFRRDGGYGPNSDCRNTHDGDNDDALYELESQDDGVIWTLTRVVLSSRPGNTFRGPDWPKDSRIEIYDRTHPVIYMSAHKHHEYLSTDWDHKESRYSDSACNDDVNGKGNHFLVNIHSIAIKEGRFTGYSKDFNNVGESDSHPIPSFVNDLGSYYPGHTAWGNEDFYEVGPTRDKWMK